MNELLDALNHELNYTYTENGGITHKTTHSALLDMFGMGGSMRNRSDSDVIEMFREAFEENPEYALKCLFYLRNCRGIGQGERRFFRVAIHWLAKKDHDMVGRNIPFIVQMGRWDDLYALVDTPVETEAFNFIYQQLKLDLQCKTPSLCAKWLKSENASSEETKKLAIRTRNALRLNSKEYRIMLSLLRKRINIVERLMSENRWDEIEFDKIPSKAGLKYRNVFAHNDYTRERYAEFMANKETKVNASVLNPVDIAQQIFNNYHPDQASRDAWQKYWDALPDYYHGREERGIAVVDVSGSMSGTPMNAAVSMGAYIAERGKGPFKDHFITFSGTPELVKFSGVDIYDKFYRARSANWNMNTNIEAVFDLLLNTAKRNHVPQSEMPETIYIFSDMEFDQCITTNHLYSKSSLFSETINKGAIDTVIEAQVRKWNNAGYKAPRVIFWNLDARQNNIPALNGRFSYISGFSMSAMEAVLSGKDGYTLMMEVLNNPIFKDIK